MRAILAAFLVSLIVATAAATGFKTVFEVKMEYPATTFEQGQNSNGAPASFLGGGSDRLYTIVAGQMGIEAVDLKAKTFLYAANTSASIGLVNAVFGTAAGAVALGETGIEAFDASGNKLFTTSDYFYRTTQYILNGTIVAAVVEDQNYYNRLIVIDFAKGKIVNSIRAVSATQIGGNAYVTFWRNQTELELTAIDVATNSTLWTIPAGSNSANVLAASSQYVFATRDKSSGDTEGLVLDPATGSTIRSLDALNGVNADCVPAKLAGDLLTLVVGEDFQRLVIYNLTTGYQIFTRTVSEYGGGCGSGSGAIVTGGSIVTMNNNDLVLTIASLTTGKTTNIKMVPSNPNGGVTAFADGIVAANNLQGYTLWDTKTATYIGRNEKAPNAGATSPIMFGSYYVSVTGNTVVVQEFVQ